MNSVLIKRIGKLIDKVKTIPSNLTSIPDSEILERMQIKCNENLFNKVKNDNRLLSYSSELFYKIIWKRILIY